MADKCEDYSCAEITDRLLEQALDQCSVESIFSACCRRLVAAGLPIWRAHIGFNTLHPLFASATITWWRDEPSQQTQYDHATAGTSSGWLQSPLYYLLRERLPGLRRRLSGPEAVLDFPVLTELREEGACDYLAYALPFGGNPDDGPYQKGIVGSWTSDHNNGFSDSQIRTLGQVQKVLAVACKTQLNEQIAANVVATYLGKDAGQRVLNGQIQRGDCERIHAVIWYSDMRNSTPLAAKLPVERFMQTVNAYFECTAGAVLHHSGEVLRFIGDAVLAIFPIRDDGDSAPEACRKALAAAHEAERRMDRLNAEHSREQLDPLDFGLGLHLGDILFGNIGVPERLEFSVIGPAANEVARLEGLTKTLGRRILVSGELASQVDMDWEALGAHALKGVGQAMEVFTLRRFAGLP